MPFFNFPLKTRINKGFAGGNFWGLTLMRKEKKLNNLVNKVNAKEKEVSSLSMDQMKEKIKVIREKPEKTEEDLVLTFALTREMARRTLGQRPFDVQVRGGLVLAQGKIAEMKTGEGKTLTATMPLVWEALKGKGAHLITVNDYLARRDTVWMGQIYHALGLTVSCLTQEGTFIYDPEYLAKKEEERLDKERDETGSFKVIKDFLRPITKQEAYSADITYGTNNEFGFDYLRDNLVYSFKNKVQRPLYYAIIDEVDNILIDEARTPLIISAPREEPTELYYQLARVVKKLKPGEDLIIDEKRKSVILTSQGQEKIIMAFRQDPWANNNVAFLYRLEAALRAETFFKLDRDYVIKNNEVLIVDEFTGRILSGRRWSSGIHEAIEAKEGLSIRQEMKTLATITFQNYFRMYEKLAGMTGTAMTEAEEFHKIYNLEVVAIPTNRKMIRKDWPDKIYQTEKIKFDALIEEVISRHKQGQPILIGTRSIEKNELVASSLQNRGLNCQVLNAKYHEREGQIIAQAGKLGAITVATNMAGRGVDIILGGNPPDPLEQKKVIELGGLCVLGTERHEARRIDNQLRGRAGRQGDPGESRFFISLEDDIARIFGGDKIKVLVKRFNLPPDYPIENKMISRLIERAQEKVEGMNFDARKYILDYDDVMNIQRKAIYQKRNNILKFKKDELDNFVLEMYEEEIREIIVFNTKDKDMEKWDISKITEELSQIFPVPINLEEKLKDIISRRGFNLEQAREEIIQYSLDLWKDNFSSWQKNIYQKISPEQLTEIERKFILEIIDYYFQNYLEEMEYFKRGIGLRAYGQHEPLDEFRREALIKFKNLTTDIRRQITHTLQLGGQSPKIDLRKPA